MSVAKIILEQLGGNKFAVITGTKQFVGGENFLKMKLSKNNLSAQYLQITLNSMDTYDLHFYSLNKSYDVITKEKVEDVYCDQLQEIFTDKTGLYTSLY